MLLLTGVSIGKSKVLSSMILDGTLIEEDIADKCGNRQIQIKPISL
jgi:hypothetical protein